MKRYIAAGLAAALLCAVCAPAYAAETQTGQTDAGTQTGPVKLTFDTLEQTVRENNITIQAYEHTIQSAEETDVSDDFFNSYIELSNQISGYEQQIRALDDAIADLKAASASGEEGEEGGPSGTDALIESLEAQKSILQFQLDAVRAQYDDLEDEEEDAEEAQEQTVANTRREMGNAADLVCVAAENTYISLQSMQYSYNQTARSLAQLDRNIAAAEKQVELGMAGENTLKSLQSQRETLLASGAALDTQVDALCNTLALQCGLSLGTEIEIEPAPAVTQAQLDAIDYDADLALALENSYSIWSSEQAVEDASDDYADGVTDNLHAYEAAQIQRDAQYESVTASFRALYQAVEEARKALDAAQANIDMARRTFAAQELQYRLGLISQMAYADAQDTLATAEETAETAQIDLITAYQAYAWAKRGVMSSAAA